PFYARRRRASRTTITASANRTNASAHGDDDLAPPMLQPCDLPEPVVVPPSVVPMSWPGAGPATDVTGAVPVTLPNASTLATTTWCAFDGSSSNVVLAES